VTHSSNISLEVLPLRHPTARHQNVTPVTIDMEETS
jgi:hypothetical protein